MIYFDNAATTPPIYTQNNFFANPSSPHALGLTAERALTTARQLLSKIINCKPSEIIFTSGGTESNNLAIVGYALANSRNNITFMAQPWEHPSVLEPLLHIKHTGLADILLAPHQEWVHCKAQNRFAVISHINHETGDIHDIAKIAKSLKADSRRTIVMVDGVQGFCKEPIDLTNVDLYSFSGHKNHGPTGTGGLMSQIRLNPLFYGGGQENKLRPGTENVSGILAMAEAAQTLYQAENNVSQIKNIMLTLVEDLPNVHVNQLSNNGSPYILNLSFLGTKGEPLVHLLSEKGLYASMGAACLNRKNTKTALEVMGFSKETAESAVRFSFSHLNTVEEATRAKEIIIQCVTQLRKMLGASYD